MGVQMQLIRRDRTFGSPTYGKDLDVMDIYGPDASEGVCLLKGFSGLVHAPRTQVKESWAYQEGVTLSDFPRVDEREIDLRFATKAKTASDWEELETRLWTILNFKQDAVIRLTSENSVRELNCRLDRKPEDKMDYFPGEVKFMVWEVTLIACDPWWYSTTLVSSWTRGSTVADGQGWYNGTVRIMNPADQECWLEWSNREIEVAETWSLPDAGYKYTADDAADVGNPALEGTYLMHTLPQLAVGKSFLVQTNPLKETLMVMDNSQMWAIMRAEDFVHTLPAGVNTPIEVPVKLKGGTANSKVSVFMTQRYDRGWS